MNKLFLPFPVVLGYYRRCVHRAGVVALVLLPALAGAQCPGIVPMFTWNTVDTVMEFTNETNTYGLPLDALLWDFGDGSYATASDTAHTYALTGVDTVSLQITVAGCPFSAAAAVVHGDGNDPCLLPATADFSSYQPANNVVQFVNGSSGAGAFLVSAWDLGDGGLPSLETSPLHAYVQPGSYPVSLNVASYDSVQQTACVAGKARLLYVDGNASSCDSSLFVDFTTDLFGSTVQLDAILLPLDPGLTVTALQWSTGDGTPMITTIPAPLHTYQYPGEYQICLSVEAYDSLAQQSCVAVVCHTIQIAEVVGVDDPYGEEGSLLLQPNPFSAELLIRGPSLRDEVHVELYDVQGRLALEHADLAQGELVVDTSLLPAGLYVLRVSTPAHLFSLRAIKE